MSTSGSSLGEARERMRESEDEKYQERLKEAKESDEYCILGQRNMKGLGQIFVLNSCSKLKGIKHKSWATIAHETLITIVVCNREIRAYMDQVRAQVKEKIEGGELESRKQIQAFCTRQNRSPFRFNTVVGESRGLFIFVSPNYDDNEISDENVCFVVKLIDCRTDSRTGALFPKTGTDSIISIEGETFHGFHERNPMDFVTVRCAFSEP